MGEDSRVSEGNSASQQSSVRGCGLKNASFVDRHSAEKYRKFRGICLQLLIQSTVYCNAWQGAASYGMESNNHLYHCYQELLRNICTFQYSCL